MAILNHNLKLYRQSNVEVINCVLKKYIAVNKVVMKQFHCSANIA